MRRSITLLALVALAALPACRSTPVNAGPRAAVELTAGRNAYRPGESATLGLRNYSTTTWGYNGCANSIVERETAQGWATVSQPDRVCTMQLAILGPGQTQTVTVPLPADLAAGRYRIALTLAREGDTSGGAASRTTAYPGTLTGAP